MLPVVRLGANFQSVFCDQRDHFYGKMPTQMTQMHAEILGAGPGEKGSAGGESFQLIQTNFIVATLPTLSTHPRARFSFYCIYYNIIYRICTYLFRCLSPCLCDRMCVTMRLVCHCSPKYLSRAKGTARSYPLIRRSLLAIAALATFMTAAYTCRSGS